MKPFVLSDLTENVMEKLTRTSHLPLTFSSPNCAIQGLGAILKVNKAHTSEMPILLASSRLIFRLTANTERACGRYGFLGDAFD